MWLSLPLKQEKGGGSGGSNKYAAPPRCIPGSYFVRCIMTHVEKTAIRQYMRCFTFKVARGQLHEVLKDIERAEKDTDLSADSLAILDAFRDGICDQIDVIQGS